MNLRQLGHFLAVVDLGSLGKASEKLHLSQPAISKSIQKLEEQLGVELLVRGARGTEPTACGRELVQHAKLINAQVDNASRQIRALRGLARGQVTFGVGPSIALAIVPKTLSRIRRAYPGVTIAVIEGYGETLSAALVDGTAEFIISPSLRGLPTGDVTHELLYTDRTEVICRVGHPLTRRRKVTMRDLADQAWVLYRKPDGFREHLEFLFEQEGLAPPTPFCETNSLPVMKASLLESDAVTFLPLPAIGDEMRRLVGITNTPCTMERKVFVIRRSLSVLSPLAATLLAELHETAAAIAS